MTIFSGTPVNPGTLELFPWFAEEELYLSKVTSMYSATVL